MGSVPSQVRGAGAPGGVPSGARARGRVPQPRCCSVTRTEQDEAAGMPREPPRHRITRCSPAHRAPARRGSASLHR